MSARGTEGMERGAGTERLLDALVEDASPVARIYPFGRVAAGVVVLYVAWWLGCVWMLGGVRDAASLIEVATDGSFVGLVSSIAGATGAAIAAREPGLERWARGSIGLLLVGLAAMLATFAVRVGDGADAFSLPQSAHCVESAVLLGGLPAGALFVVALGGWRGRPVLTSLAAATSGAALGAIAVHVTCPAQGAWHVLFAHYVLPVGAALAVGALGAWVWRRLVSR